MLIIKYSHEIAACPKQQSISPPIKATQITLLYVEDCSLKPTHNKIDNCRMVHIVGSLSYSNLHSHKPMLSFPESAFFSLTLPICTLHK